MSTSDAVPAPSLSRSSSMEMDVHAGRPVPPNARVTVIGGGSFGLCMASIVGKKGMYENKHTYIQDMKKGPPRFTESWLLHGAGGFLKDRCPPTRHTYTYIRTGIPTTILVRKSEHAEHINTHHSHPQHLSEITLHPAIRASADPEVCVCFGG